MMGTVITIPENFIVDDAGRLREEVMELLNKGEKNIEVDFSHCKFIDSTGLGVLVSAFKKCNEFQASFKISHLIDENVKRVFHLARLERVFEII